MTRTTNVCDLPWIPVRVRGSDVALGLREVFVRAHEIEGLATDLAPVEREALLRCLESVAAMILRRACDDDPSEINAIRAAAGDAPYPRSHVDGFFDEHHDAFWLDDPERPFLQEWHVDRGADPQFRKHAKALSALHVHVPGAASSQWGLRHEHRDAADPAVLALLLVVAWWHGKPSNGGRPSTYAGKCIAGAPSGGGFETSFHYIGANLAQTLHANTLREWVFDDETLPAWLDQDLQPAPGQLQSARCLWRSTWTPNRPLVLWEGSRPTGYVIGLTSRPIPLIGSADPKEAAKAIHTADYCHAWMAPAKPGDPPRAAVVPERLLSTRGALTWLTKGSDKAAATLADGRLITTDRVGFHTERGDTYGSRTASYWVEVPTSLLIPDDAKRDELLSLLTFIEEVGKAMASPLGRATDLRVDGRHRSALLEAAQRDYFSETDSVTVRALASETPDAIGDPRVAQDIVGMAERVFAAHLHQFETPSTYYRTAEARARFGRAARDLLTEHLAAITTKELS